MLQIPREKKSVKLSPLPSRFEGRLLFSVLFVGAPSVFLSLLLLWKSSYSFDHKMEGTLVVVLLWLSLSVMTRDNVVNSLRVLSNVVSAMKDDDFSFRATKAISGDAL